MIKKPFRYSQCELCKFFIQHYNISDERIFKVSCGHCTKDDKDVKPSARKCKYFSPLIPQIEKELDEVHAIDVLKKVEKELKHLKIYLQRKDY